MYLLDLWVTETKQKLSHGPRLPSNTVFFLPIQADDRRHVKSTAPVNVKTCLNNSLKIIKDTNLPLQQLTTRIFSGHATKTHLDIFLWVKHWSFSAYRSPAVFSYPYLYPKSTQNLKVIFWGCFLSDLGSQVLLPCWVLYGLRGSTGRPCFCQAAFRKTLHHHLMYWP